MRSSTWQPFLPPAPEASPPLCRSVNVEGTRNVLSAARKAGRDPVVVLVSSASVVGPTQDREPPVRVGDPVAPNDEYVRCKVEAEAEVRGSGLRACVLRLVAVMPTIPSFPMRQVVAGFDLPLGARCKAVTDVDAATACVAAAESLLSEVAQHPAGSHERSENSGLTRGSVFFVGGGKKGGWQIRVRDMCKAVFEPAGLSLPGEHLFTSNPNRFPVDWSDTDEAQRLFHYQNHTLSDCRQIVSRKYQWIRPLVRLVEPLMSWYLGRLSPYGPARRLPFFSRKRPRTESEA